MQRAIVTPANVPGSALDELKQWLAITSSRENTSLAQLLRAALDTCEAFTRAVPLETTFEEVHELCSGWQRISVEPVRAITGVDGVAADGTRFTLPVDHYLIDLASDAAGRFRILAAPDAVSVAVTYTAGLAANWDALPASLRHGLVRLAAHHFRSREADNDRSLPPSVVAALWHPFRRMRLA